MLTYDEQLPVLDDTFEAEEVALLAVRGRKVDPHFRRNYAWAKHAVARGAVKKVVVVVAVTKETWVHTVGAITSALSGERLPAGFRFKIDAEVRDIGSDRVTKVLEAVETLKAPEGVTFSFDDFPKVVASAKPKAPKPAAKPASTFVEKPEAGGDE